MIFLGVLWNPEPALAIDTWFSGGYELQQSTAEKDLGYGALSASLGLKTGYWAYGLHSTFSDTLDFNRVGFNEKQSLDSYSIDIKYYPLDIIRIIAVGLRFGLSKQRIEKTNYGLLDKTDVNWSRVFAPMLEIDLPLGRHLTAGVTGTYQYHIPMSDSFDLGEAQKFFTANFFGRFWF